MLESIVPVHLLSDFESGNGCRFEQVGEVVKFEIEPDTESTDRQWFYFRVQEAKGRPLRFELQNTDQTNIALHWDTARPVFSSDGGQSWWRVAGSVGHDRERNVFFFEHTPASDDEHLAFHHPYTLTMMNERMAEWEKHPAVSRRTIGRSVEGRPIELLTVSTSTLPEKERLGIWVTSRQHAAETCASFFLDGFMEWVLSEDEAAKSLLSRASIHVAPMLNPDGVVAGNYRDNARGVNLNRMWKTPDEETSPEILAITTAVREWVGAGNRYDLYIDLHGDSEAHAHYAFHASDTVRPPKYPQPELYGEHSRRLLSMIARRNADFTPDEGEVDNDDPSLSRQYMTFEYGVLAVLFEGSYTYVGYGPNKGVYLTPDRHAEVGRSAAEAVAEYFGG